MTDDPANELQDKVTATAAIIHDQFVDAGCDCEYVVGVSWQCSTAANPLVTVRHAPECGIFRDDEEKLATEEQEEEVAEDLEPKAESEDAEESSKKSAPRRTRKKAAEPAPEE